VTNQSAREARSDTKGDPARSSSVPEMTRYFPGTSEMAARMRTFDWSTTGLGPPHSWPENLLATVRTCLTSRFPIVVWWGSNYTMFYNDAYRSFLGRTKHPQWLGRSGKDCWREIWPVIGPMLEGVLTTAEATWSEDLLLTLDRNLPREEGYFTFSYSPILDNYGDVNGIFCACYETTEQVVGTRRLETLRQLGAQALETRTVDGVCEEAAGVLAENPFDIPFAAIYLSDAEGTHAVLKSVAGFSQDIHPFPSSVSVSDDYILPWPLTSVLRTRTGIEVSDLISIGMHLPGGPWPEAASGAIVLPILAAKRENLSGLVILGVSPRRVLDNAYRTFFSLVTSQIGAAISGATAYEAEQKRAEALAELDRAKTTFFSNVSHEFRTPLTLMLGPLEDELRENPDARGRLEIAHRNTLRLLKLVNTLLDFSRIEAGRIEASYEPTDLAAYTADLASVFRSAIETAGMRFVVDTPPLPEPVHVDREMWEKIILNLLSNAFKFTFEGEIKIALRWCGEWVELSVHDTGCGIPDTELPKIFQRFHRVHGTKSRTHEGTGIGLALVQELVRLHGGEIRVHSTEGEGSTFTITVQTGTAHLPADRIGAVREQVSTSVGPKPFIEEALRWLPKETSDGVRDVRIGSQFKATATRAGVALPRILFADDNADMRTYVARLLAPYYEVETVADGQAALERIRANPPNLVLADIMMPRVDGFGLLRQMQSDERTLGIPVIMLSARAGDESRVEGLNAGADDYLIKPFNARELLARVRSQLEIVQLRGESQEGILNANAQLNQRLTELENANREIHASRRATLNLIEDVLEAKEALRASEDRLRASLAYQTAVANNMAEGLYTLDPQGLVISVNLAAEAILGWTSAELVGKKIHDVTHYKHPDGTPFPASECPSLQVLQTGVELREHEDWFIRKDGSFFPVVFSSSPMRADGKITGLVVSFRDNTERKRAEEALQALNDRLATELSASQLLQEISAQLIQEGDTTTLYPQIMDAAVSIMCSDYASMQILHPERGSNGELHLLAFRGFNPQTAKFWEWVRPDSPSSCGAALRSGQRVIVPDIETCDFMAGTDDLTTCRESGIRAMQTTPLVSRSGRLLGMISTHWRNPHQPSERQLGVLDILARQTADLIERKQAETAMRESEERFRILANTLPQLAWMADTTGWIFWYNQRWYDYTGTTAKEMEGWGWQSVHDPEQLPKVLERWRESIATGKPFEMIFPLRGADHEFRSFLTLVSPMRDADGKVVRWFGTNTDITEQRNAELALQEANSNLERHVKERTSELETRNTEILAQSKQLQELSVELMQAQDEERRRISRELHDSLGQYLAHAKMSAEALKKADATEKERKSVEHMIETLDKCLTETRTLAHLLHPPLLEEIGLVSAAQWYAEGFSERSGIRANVKIPHETRRLPSALELGLFRILQESLTNVHRHSKSQSVDIELLLDANEVILQVKDYGPGMPPELLQRVRGKSGTGGGVGLKSMRERISELGGRFEIESDKNGTLIRVAVPLSNGAKESEMAAGNAG